MQQTPKLRDRAIGDFQEMAKGNYQQICKTDTAIIALAGSAVLTSGVGRSSRRHAPQWTRARISPFRAPALARRVRSLKVTRGGDGNILTYSESIAEQRRRSGE
jgi:hypothetical protein